MPRPILFAIDVVAIAVLSFGIYFPRYRRRDLLVSFVSINVGVMAVLVALGSTSVGTGVGIGLFGVLSIIRLRSEELSQAETGYYFAALALGLLGGVHLDNPVLSPLLSAVILLSLYVFDHPALLHSYRHRVIVLDRAHLDEVELVDDLQRRVGGRVVRIDVQRIDFVNDTTTVDVRYRRGAPAVREAITADLTSSEPHVGAARARQR